MKNKILPTEQERKEKRAALLTIPGEMSDPSYIDALAGTVKAVLEYRAPGEQITLADAREIVLACVANGYYRPLGWGTD